MRIILEGDDRKLSSEKTQKSEIVELIKEYTNVHCKNRTVKEKELFEHYSELGTIEQKKFFWSELFEYLYFSATDYEQSILKQLIQTIRKTLTIKEFQNIVFSINNPTIRKLVPKITKDFFPKENTEKSYSKENDPLYQNKLVLRLYQEGDFEEALKYCNHFLKKNPKNIALLKLKVRLLEKLDKKVQAKKTKQYLEQIMGFDDYFLQSVNESKQTKLDQYFK